MKRTAIRLCKGDRDVVHLEYHLRAQRVVNIAAFGFAVRGTSSVGILNDEHNNNQTKRVTLSNTWTDCSNLPYHIFGHISM